MSVMNKPTPLFKMLPIADLRRGQYQPRRDFDPISLEELARSIAEQGIVEPIIVRPINQQHYEIIAGERRWRAAQSAGLDKVPCIVNHYTDKEAAEITLIENIQREDLNPIEEAMAYKQLMDEFHYIHEEIADSLGKSRTKITNALRLLKLDTRVQQLLIEKKISEGHGKILAGVPYEKQYEFAKKCIENEWSVRKIEEAVKNQGILPSTPVSQNKEITRLERLISEHLSSEVKLENNESSRSGWLKIKYHDYEILNGILEKIGITKD